MTHAADGADPLEQIGLEDTQAESLWDEEGEAAQDDELGFGPSAQALPGQTVALEEDDQPTSETPASEQAWQAGETERMDEVPPSDAPAQLADDLDELDEADLVADAADELPLDDTADGGGQGADDDGQDAPAEEERAADDSATSEESSAGAPDEPADEEGEAPMAEPPLTYTGRPNYEYETGPFETIHVEHVDNWQGPEAYRSHEQLNHDAWQGRPRPSERRDSRIFMSQNRESPSLAAVVAIALALILVGGIATAIHRSLSSGVTPRVSGHQASTKEASALIESLDGWWKTDRTLDGRYWLIQTRLLEQYTADGKLYPTQQLIDPASVDRMETGPAGIEGSGYYLKDIGYYVVDGNTDTLFAIDSDGSAADDANLYRTDPPSFAGKTSGETASTTPPEGDAEEYILPESATRIYLASELDSLSDHDLFVARNEIFARHGYTFMPGELSEYFSSKSWYHPTDSFNEGELNEFERQNVSTILSVEQSRGSQYV